MTVAWLCQKGRLESRPFALAGAWREIFTQGADGSLVKLADAQSNLALLPPSVASQMGPSGADAIAALINPNWQGGAWLAGRDAASLMGRPMRSAPFLAGQAVVVGSEDGFLYGFDKKSGALLWGFIPANLLPSAQKSGALIGSQPWGQGAYVDQGANRYALGTAMQGAEHLALKIAPDGSLLSVAWDDYEPAAPGATDPVSPASPAGGAAPTTAVDQSGSAAGKVAYIVNNSIKRVALADGSAAQLDPLPTTATSNLLYVSDSAAYYGDSLGSLKGALGAVDAGSLGESSGAPVLWATGAYQNASGAPTPLVYLLASSATRATAFKAGRQGAPAAGVALWQISSTSSPGAPSLPSGALLSAMPAIANGYVFLGATTGADHCSSTAQEIGPLALATGASALAGATFRLAGISSAVMTLGTGEALFAAAGFVAGRPGIFALANGGGTSTAAQGAALASSQWAQYGYASADSGSQNKRVSWRELTNFIVDAVTGALS